VRTADPAWAERTLADLREAGYRRSGAREAVVRVLGRQDCCASVAAIYDAVRAEGGSVGYASVYRVLELLVARGRVQKIDVGAGRAHYEPADPAGGHHHHVVCTECGRVDPFADDQLEAALHRVETELASRVGAHDVLLRGACGECRPALPV